MNLKNVFSNPLFQAKFCTQSADWLTGPVFQGQICGPFHIQLFHRHNNSPAFSYHWYDFFPLDQIIRSWWFLLIFTVVISHFILLKSKSVESSFILFIHSTWSLTHGFTGWHTVGINQLINHLSVEKLWASMSIQEYRKVFNWFLYLF